ncbi:MAG: molybdate ABC transporter substrate-binding protein [Gammaproteobacteria bacterium]|nr:molybdate ABC transporter substrate-binding protein [Gammaproteobacteria bacterium]
MFLVALFSADISPAGAREPLNIAVAANVRYAFDELAAAFRRETGIETAGVYASSGKLTAQIMNGAPFDVFLSADMEYPDRLQREGYAVDPPVIYAYGALVVWTLTGLDLTPGVRALAAPGVSRVAYANPRLAPYGRAAEEALAHYGVLDAVRAKAVSGESISQVNQYIHSRNVEAGFTAKAVVRSPAMRGTGTWIEVPRDAYRPIAQGVVVLKHGADTAARDCARFVEFLASDPARAILADYGYTLP